MNLYIHIHVWLCKVAAELDALEGGRAVTRENSHLYVNLCTCIYIYIHGFVRGLWSWSRWKAAQQSLGKMYMYMSTYIYIYIYIYLYTYTYLVLQGVCGGGRAGSGTAITLENVYVYVNIYIYIYTYTYTYMVLQGGCGAGRAGRRHSNHTGKCICICQHIYIYTYIHIYIYVHGFARWLRGRMRLKAAWQSLGNIYMYM